jgi:putative spermidine/putrescine transport system substrate-binding protein
MTALIAAARREGTLTVIGVPGYWANYGKIIKNFESTYGIRVRSVSPGASSQQEIVQIQRENGSPAAADVLDLDTAVAQARAGLFAPYQVVTWPAIPAGQKQPDGRWVQDYGGFMSVGYNSARFGTITSLRQLLGPRFRNAVALPGDPVRAPAALMAVMMANLALGGQPGNIATGVGFFGKLRAAGNFNPVGATVLTIESGATPVVFNWDELNTAAVVGRPGWKVFIPANAVLGGFFAQAINARAPHPAAARLWEEFLFSQGRAAGQNLWLEGGVRPVEQAAMAADGAMNRAAAAALPPVPGTPLVLTAVQTSAAQRYLAAAWARAVG